MPTWYNSLGENTDLDMIATCDKSNFFSVAYASNMYLCYLTAYNASIAMIRLLCLCND